jgi:hypothetical protein
VGNKRAIAQQHKRCLYVIIEFVSIECWSQSQPGTFDSKGLAFDCLQVAL